MPISDPGFYLIAVPAVIFLGVSKGGFGSGADFVSMAILALVLPPGQALGLLIPLLLLMDLANLRAYWGKWDSRIVRVLLVGAVPGVALGVLVYRIVDDDAVRVLIGAIAVLFVLWRVALESGWIRPPRAALPEGVGVVAGLVSGFASFISHGGGPAATAYLFSLRLEKTTFQATTVLAFWVVNILKLAGYVYLGLMSVDLLVTDLILMPFALFGIWLGIKAHRLLPDVVFFRVAYVLLLIAGGKLIWDGMT
ncbi:sulfite exporter TauE/SafE family protein [Phaeobacter marinintestinus]|uniref:sulfite exporter TauE/SafE family protein n=1 Tax=Falsiphaeobacter marinintestinus TaxID=1492905 RepID=UPI001FE7697D|nr:sulfite exporter TauE/SafE family protein [Phaeobacter marinintestinus]